MSRARHLISLHRVFLGAAVCAAIGLASCASVPEHLDSNYGEEPAGSYKEALDHWTESDKAYRGAVESLQVTATLLSRDIVEHQTYIDAAIYHWTPDQYRDKRQKALYDNESATSFFVVFYTNRDESNDLDKSDSQWNIFLDANGARVTPTTIKRVYEKRDVLEAHYPNANVWSRYYTVTFPLPTSQATQGGSELTIAGAVGAVHLKFPQ